MSSTPRSTRTSSTPKHTKNQLEDLKLQIDIKQKKIDAQNAKIKKQKQNMEIEKRNLTKQRKKLEKGKRQFEMDKISHQKRQNTSQMKIRRTSSNMSRLQSPQLLTEIQQKYTKECKKSADLQKKLDEMTAQNNVLNIKLSNALGTKKTFNEEDPRLRQLITENRDLRKKIRKLFTTINAEKRWYVRQIKIFKNNQNKWIEKQRAIMKDKKVIIKYVFIDDIKYIKQYRKQQTNVQKNKNDSAFQNRVKFKMKNGAETTRKNVEIIVLDSDNIGGETGDSESKEEESEVFMEELMKEFGISNDIENEDGGNENETENELKSDFTLSSLDLLSDKTENLLSDKTDENMYKNEMEMLQKRVDELQKNMEEKDAMIESLKTKPKTVNFALDQSISASDEADDGLTLTPDAVESKDFDTNTFTFTTEYDSRSKKQAKRKKRRYNKLNVVINQKLDIIKQEVHCGSAVKDSPFKWDDRKSKKLEKELKKKANPFRTEIFALKSELSKVKRENEQLKLQLESSRQK